MDRTPEEEGESSSPNGIRRITEQIRQTLGIGRRPAAANAEGDASLYDRVMDDYYFEDSYDSCSVYALNEKVSPRKIPELRLKFFYGC